MPCHDTKTIGREPVPQVLVAIQLRYRGTKGLRLVSDEHVVMIAKVHPLHSYCGRHRRHAMAYAREHLTFYACPEANRRDGQTAAVEVRGKVRDVVGYYDVGSVALANRRRR